MESCPVADTPIQPRSRSLFRGVQRTALRRRFDGVTTALQRGTVDVLSGMSCIMIFDSNNGFSMRMGVRDEMLIVVQGGKFYLLIKIIFVFLHIQQNSVLC